MKRERTNTREGKEARRSNNKRVRGRERVAELITFSKRDTFGQVFIKDIERKGDVKKTAKNVILKKSLLSFLISF